MKNIIYILVIFLSFFIFSACSSKSVTKPNLDANIVSINKLPYTVLVDGSNIEDFFLDEDFGLITTTVDYKEALLESVKLQLQNNFKEVYIVGADKDINKYN